MIFYYLQMLVAFVVMELGFRVLYLFAFTDIFNLSMNTWSLISFTGFRFDLMVFAYATSVHYLVMALLSWTSGKDVFFFKFSKFYFSFVFIAIGGISFMDFIHLGLFADRFINESLHRNWLSVFSFDFFTHWKLIVILALTPLWSWGWVRRIQESSPQFSWPVHWSKFLMLGLGLVSAGRGSYGAHHLDLRHSLISIDKMICLATIPSAYALDQALRSRR